MLSWTFQGTYRWSIIAITVAIVSWHVHKIVLGIVNMITRCFASRGTETYGKRMEAMSIMKIWTPLEKVRGELAAIR